MPKVEYKTLLDQLKTGRFGGAYVLYGQEQYVLRRCLERLLKTVVTAMPQFNLIRFEGEKGTLDWEAVEDAVESMPMMAAYKAVVLHDVNPDKLAADENKRLTALFKNAPESTILVYYISGFEIDLKAQKKLASFLKAAEKFASVVECKPADRNQIAQAMINAARKQKCFLSRDTADRIAELSGQDLTVLLGEVDKLCAYAGEGKEITREAVDRLVIRSIDASAFELADAVVQGNADKAMYVLADLKEQRYEPVMISGAVASSLIDLYRVKTARTAGKQTADIIADFGYNPRLKFRVEKAQRISGKVSVEKLRRCMEAFQTLDTSLKTSRSDSYELIEIAIVQAVR